MQCSGVPDTVIHRPVTDHVGWEVGTNSISFTFIFHNKFLFNQFSLPIALASGLGHACPKCLVSHATGLFYRILD